MFLQGGGKSKYVTLQGGGTCGLGGVWIKCVMSKHFSVDVYLEYSQNRRFHAFTGWRTSKCVTLQGGGTCG